ncbi:MAG: amino acid ABC transporter permease [Turicibacter sp.]|nr:amino acid ABC transporter permease [Turicibacter sp.]
MLEGLKIVLLVFFLTLLFSIPLAILVTFLRLNRLKLISSLTNLYILLMRGTPLLLQLIVIYYGLPLIGITFDRFDCAIIAFTLNYTAYFAEIFRGGLQSIDRGQFEASKVLGFTPQTMYLRIIFPQVIKRILPSLANEVITLIKDTSLVYILGLNDILRVAQIASNRELSLFPLFEVGLIYLLMIAVLSKLFAKLEAHYTYYR